MASAKRACETTITRADSSGMPDRMHPFFDEQCISEDLVYIPSVIQVLCGKALRDSKVPPPPVMLALNARIFPRQIDPALLTSTPAANSRILRSHMNDEWRIVLTSIGVVPFRCP